MNKGYIYKLSFRDELLYVGQTRRPKERDKQHLYSLRSNIHFNYYLQNIYNKYKESFENEIKYEIIEKVDIKDLTEREIFWINTLNPKCNLAIPNENNSWTVSNTTRAKQSKIHKGKKQSKEHIMKRMESAARTRNAEGYKPPHPAWNKGLTSATDSRIRKTSEWMTSEIQQRRVAARKATVETWISEEQKQRISETLKDYYKDFDKEIISNRVKLGMMRSGASEKISKARRGKTSWNKGIPRTNEVKQKLSDDWSKRPWVICDECGGSFRLLASHKTKKHNEDNNI